MATLPRSYLSEKDDAAQLCIAVYVLLHALLAASRQQVVHVGSGHWRCQRHSLPYFPRRHGCRHHHCSGPTLVPQDQLRNGQSKVGRPKWTKMDLFRPKRTILVHFGLANAKLQFRIRSFGPKWPFGPFWTILVQYTFRQYRGHSLSALLL